MKDNYHFILVLRGVNENTANLEDALFQAGCDDALISYKNKVVSLTFDRSANNLETAIISAIKDIESADIPAKVAYIEGGFVTLSEIAEKSGFTKQAISLFIKGDRGNGQFPVPFSDANKLSPIWRWSDVLAWLYDNKKIQDENLLAQAEMIDSINMVLQLRVVQHIEKYKRLLRRVG